MTRRTLRQTSTAAYWILRIIIWAVFAAAILFVVLGLVSNYLPISKQPNVTEAPWLIKTSSRIYFVKQFSLLDGVPAAKGYWTMDGKRYHFHDGIKTFPYDLYGKPDVLRRASQ